jgi:transposase-like protein
MKVVEKKAKDEMIEKPGETEGARRATGVFPGSAPPTGGAASRRPDLEVVAKAERRRFTTEYKQRIVREADRCTKPGEIGALLRREGLYSSHLVTWRAARDRGGLAGLSPRKRGPKVAPPDPRVASCLFRGVGPLDRFRAIVAPHAELGQCVQLVPQLRRIFSSAGMWSNTERSRMSLVMRSFPSRWSLARRRAIFRSSALQPLFAVLPASCVGDGSWVVPPHSTAGCGFMRTLHVLEHTAPSA